jgi:hypothetical protein
MNVSLQYPLDAFYHLALNMNALLDIYTLELEHLVRRLSMVELSMLKTLT